MMRILGALVIGFLFGYLGIAVASGDTGNDIAAFFSATSMGWNIFFLVLAFVLFMYALISYFSIKSMAREDVSGEEEDRLEGKMYRRYSDATLSATLAMVTAIFSLSITVITGPTITITVLSMLIVIAALLLSISINGLIHEIYPERKLPSVNDKKYAEKLLKASDDGEKHVMLEGLYRTFINMNALLLMALFALLAYSIVSGTSQLFGIFVVALVLSFGNVQYMSIIRKK